MKKVEVKFLITLLTLILAFTGNTVIISQPWYFNEIYNPNNTNSGGISIIGNSEGYFGCAVSPDSISGYYNLCTFQLDFEGSIVYWKNYGQSGYLFYAGYYGSLIQTPDEGYAVFGSKNEPSGRDQGIFFKFTSLGDTIFTRTFTSETYNTLIGRACVSLYDGGFALVGEVQMGSNYSDIILIKTDSNGIEQWRTQHGTSIDDNANSIIQTPDGGYALGTWSRIPGQEETANPLVYKTDSLGNEEWHLNLGGPLLDDKTMLCNTTDNCIMVLTGYADSMYTPEYAYAKVNLVKIDLDGNVIWNKKYGESMPANLISNIICLENGDFVACGYSPPPSYVYFNWTGWIFRFNSNGDSLWYRNYYYYPEDPDFALNYLYDVSQANDNGFVTVGQAYISSPPLVQKMWVLKVDSIGCEIPNCWVGVEEDLETRGQGEEGRLVIWPNPATNIVNCQLSIVNLKSNSSSSILHPSLVIYDIFGRTATAPCLLVSRSPSPQDGSWQVDISALPPGIYIAVTRDERTIIGTGKFVVVR